METAKITKNIETVSYNLSALQKKDTSISERTLAHIDEAARELASLIPSEGGSILENEDFLSAYYALVDRSFSVDQPLPSNVPKQTQGRLSALKAEDAVNSAIFLCDAICKAKEKGGEPLKYSDFFAVNPESSEGEKIAYLRNPYSDTAFLIFSEVIKNASVSYPRDFAGVCEEVYYGRCRYCILPVETSDEGALSGFRRLIAKYELCPILSCPVSTAGGSQTTEFALFAKNIEFPDLEKGKSVRKNREILSFRLNAPSEMSFNKTIRALHLYGLRLLKIDSSPVAWDEGHYSFEITAECGGSSLTSALLYLTLEIPEYSPIGYYTQITLP